MTIYLLLPGIKPTFSFSFRGSLWQVKWDRPVSPQPVIPGTGKDISSGSGMSPARTRDRFTSPVSGVRASREGSDIHGIWRRNDDFSSIDPEPTLKNRIVPFAAGLQRFPERSFFGSARARKNFVG